MKTQHISLNAFALCAALAIIIALVTGLSGAKAQDRTGANPSISNHAAQFGVVSVAPSQRARLNVVHELDAAGSGDPHHGDPHVHQFLIGFDIYGAEPPSPSAAGRPAAKYRLLRRETSEVTLRPGEAASVELPGSGEGTKVQAVIVGQHDERPIVPCVIPTLEVIEADTGKTGFALQGAERMR